MAAATVDSTEVQTSLPYVIQRTQLSALTSGQTENVTYTTAAGAPLYTVPLLVQALVTAPASDGSLCTGEWIKASDSPTTNTVAVKYKVEGGGSIAGAKGTVVITWLIQGRQNGQSITQDNNT